MSIWRLQKLSYLKANIVLILLMVLSKKSYYPVTGIMGCRQSLEYAYLSQFRKCLGCQNLDTITGCHSLENHSKL